MLLQHLMPLDYIKKFLGDNVKEKHILDKVQKDFVSNIPNIDTITIKMQALSETVPIGERYGDNLEAEHMEWISNGEVEKCRESFYNDFTNLVLKGGVFAESITKHVEYSTVMQCVIYTNAAINGGVSPKVAWAIREFFLRKTDKASSITEYYSICYELLMTCVTIARELRNSASTNKYVNKAKAIVASNLESIVSVQDLAKQLGITADYLCKVFKSYEGKSIKNYISEQRLKTAAQLLRYTDYSIIDICQLCGFSSQSYFAKLFKEFFGESPIKYRKTQTSI